MDKNVIRRGEIVSDSGKLYGIASQKNLSRRLKYFVN